MHPTSRKRQIPFADLPDVLTPEQLRAFLPLGRNAIYEALRAKIIPSVRVGQKYLIAKSALRDFLPGLGTLPIAGIPFEENS